MKQDQGYGTPTLLSLVFPGLGQLAKGQWKRAVMFWALLFVPWTALVGFTTVTGFEARYTPSLGDILQMVVASPLFPIVVLGAVIVWVWSVVDAYRRPA